MSALRNRPGLIVGLFLVATVVGACSTAGGASTAPGSAAATTVTVGSATSPTLGAFLTGPNRMTLYTKTGDSTASTNCTGQCLANWPPLTVTAGQTPMAGTGVTGTLATFTRPDGTVQVTYGGMPLYFWVKDAKPGDTTGQGVGGFMVATVAGASSSAAPAGSSSGSGGGRYGGSAAPVASGGYSY